MNSSRRSFIKRSTVAGAGLSLMSYPMMAKSYRRILGANERIHIGMIGIGGMGGHHLGQLVNTKDEFNHDIIAVCDIWDKRRENAAAKSGGKAYKRYEEVLSQKEIDYVMIATQEHWHHRMILDALDAGKHVYTEKPMVHEIKEGFEVRDKVRETGLKLQVGVQGTSDDSYITARKYIEEGALGKVTIAQIDYSRNGNLWQYQIDPDANPNTNLDWKAWLGPAPKVDWDPKRYFQWRRYWDYSGGIATDLFIHRLTRMLKALDLKFPKYVTGTGGHFFFTGEDKAEVPDTFNMSLDYPEGLNILLVSAQKNNTPIRHMIRGDKATLVFHGEGFSIIPQERETYDLINDLEKLKTSNHPGVIHHQKSGAEDVKLHHQNLQHAIRKGTALNCDVNLGLYGMVACKMGVMSFRKRKYLKWDEAKQKPVKA